MPYDESLQQLHPFAMTRDQLKQEAEHINGMMPPGIPNPSLEQRLSMIETAENMHDRLMRMKPSQAMLEVEVDFSPALRAEIIHKREENARNMHWAIEYLEAHGKSEGDHRDFASMIEYEKGLTQEEKKSKFDRFMEDYYSEDPTRRKKCLDSFLDRMEAIDTTKLDLSCLKESKTTGDGTGRLTQSEKDVLKLLDRYRNDQTITVKSEVENPDYFSQRYHTPQAMGKVKISRNLFTEGYVPYLTMGLLAYNNFSDNLTEVPEYRMGSDRNVAVTLWTGLEKQKPDIAVLEGLPYQRIIHTALNTGNAEELQKMIISRDGSGGFTKESANVLNRVYGDAFGNSYEETAQRRARNELGIREADMLFVDGVSANELYGEKYSKLPLEEQEKKIRYEVAAAVLEGTHRIELASLHIDSNGAYKTALSPVAVNLHAMDAQEKSKRSVLRRAFDFGPFKIKTTADRLDALNKSDPEREGRQLEISQKLAAVITQKALAKDDFATRGPALDYQARLEAERQKNRTPEIDAILQPEEASLAAGKHRVEEAAAVNKELREQYDKIDAVQFKAENYSRAVRKLAELEGQLETMTGMQNDETDINHPMFNSLHEALPVNTDKNKANELSKIYQTRIMPDIRLYEFADQNQDTTVDVLAKQLEEETINKDPNQKKLELLGKMIDNPDPEGRKKIRDEYLQNLKAGIREYKVVYKEVLDNHPNRELAAPADMTERSQRMTDLKSQRKPVPDELLKEVVLQEAKVYMLQEEHKLLQREDLPSPNNKYEPPKTKEEALQRIVDIDKKNMDAKPFMEANEGIMKGKSFFTGDPMASRPAQMVRFEVREFLQYMDGLQIDTGVLEGKEREAYDGVRKQLDTIAQQEPTAPMPIPYYELSGMSNAVVNAQATALGANPDFLRISKTDDISKQYYKDKNERRHLIHDLAQIQREEEKTKKTENLEVDKDKTKDMTGASKRVSMNLEELTREAKEVGEMPSAKHIQRNRSLSTPEMKQQTREESKSENTAGKAVHKKEGPSRT